MKDIFYVDAKYISNKAEVYSINYKLFNNIFKSEKKEDKLKIIIKNSENQTLLRILKLKRMMYLKDL